MEVPAQLLLFSHSSHVFLIMFPAIAESFVYAVKLCHFVLDLYLRWRRSHSAVHLTLGREEKKNAVSVLKPHLQDLHVCRDRNSVLEGETAYAARELVRAERVS